MTQRIIQTEVMSFKYEAHVINIFHYICSAEEIRQRMGMKMVVMRNNTIVVKGVARTRGRPKHLLVLQKIWLTGRKGINNPKA